VSSDDHHSAELEVGVITRLHGVRGAVKLRLHNPASEALQRTDRLRLVLQDGTSLDRSFSLQGRSAELCVVQIAGVDDPQQAETLRGARVLVQRQAAGPLSEGQYLYADLLGCQVQDPQRRPLGRVHGVFEAGASDVLVVRDGDQERMIPLVEQWVVEVDPARKLIVVRDADAFEPQPV
jgi:16S rRNA processing protein RimM